MGAPLAHTLEIAAFSEADFTGLAHRRCNFDIGRARERARQKQPNTVWKSPKRSRIDARSSISGP